MIKTIDLHFQQQDGAIAAFLIETDAGPALVETGPHSTLAALTLGLQQHGYALSDVKHVFVTHIHLDHAGAAWVFADQGATIYVHPVGYPHLHEPEKLMSSARRIYQENMDSLWGEMRPIAAERLRAVPDKKKVKIGNTVIRARHTPGHAVHHVAWEMGKVVFTGDVAGVKIGENGPVMPPCPPPDINIEDWMNSIAYLRSGRYDALYLTHFGEVQNPKAHLVELEGRLKNWLNWIRPHWEAGIPKEAVVPLFKGFVERHLEVLNLSKEDKQRYALANPAEMSVAGLYRYLTKKAG